MAERDKTLNCDGIAKRDYARRWLCGANLLDAKAANGKAWPREGNAKTRYAMAMDQIAMPDSAMPRQGLAGQGLAGQSEGIDSH